MHNLRNGCALLLIAALLLEAAMGGLPVAAASSSVTSAATPSNATPEVGEEIVVTIRIDMSGAPEHKLGSFTGTLNWNPVVLAYKANSGIQSGYTGLVNTTQVASGQLTFNGANALGVTGNIVVVTITFDVLRTGTSTLNLEYSAMAAALTFTGLLPILTVTDGQVVVGSGVQYSVFLPTIHRRR